MQTATVATRPTAKQMLAAKKAAKKLTQEERALKRAGAVRNVDRNRLSTLSKAQKENIAEMLSGAKVSEDEAVTCSVKMWLSMQDMRYACNQELINFAEHIIKQVQRLGRKQSLNGLRILTTLARISVNSCCVRYQISLLRMKSF